MSCRCAGEEFQRVGDRFPVDEVEPEGPDAIEVDFERTIQMVNPEAKIYVLDEDVATVASGLQPMPLTLRANVGDCLKVKLSNKMKQGRASFSALGLAFDRKIPWVQTSVTIRASKPSRRVKPRLYVLCRSIHRGDCVPGVGLGNVMTNPRNGLYGGIVIGPKGATYRDPEDRCGYFHEEQLGRRCHREPDDSGV